MADNQFAGLDDAVSSVMQQEKSSTAMQIRNNLQSSVTQNPDQAAHYQHLAKFVGVPVETVQQDPDIIKQQAANMQVDADALANQTPQVAKYLTDQNNSAKSHDDIPSLAGMETAVKGLPAPTSPAPSFGDKAMDFVKDNFKSLVSAPGSVSAPMELLKGLGGAFNKAAGSVNMVLGAAPTLYDKAASLLTGKQQTDASDAWFQRFVDPRLNAQPAFDPDQNASFAGKAANTAGNLLGMLSQIVLTGPAGEAAPAATSVPELLGQVATHGAKSMAFPAISDSVATANKVYQDTGDAGQAIRAAQMQYATTTLGGMVPLSAPGGLAARLAGGFASGVATGELSRTGMNMVLPPSMQQPFDFESLVLSGMAGAGMGGVMGPRGEPAYHDVLRQTYAEADKAEQSQQGMQSLQALGEMATASKTRTRDPEAFRQLVQDMTENGNLQDVYISADKLGEVLNQSGVSVDQLAKTMPEVAEQLHEANMTNGDVRIPVEDYATHIAGGPVDAALMPHLKIDPDGMTYQEGQDYFSKQKESMQTQADQIVADKQADDAKQADAQDVHDKILDQLNTLGRFNPEVNKSYASLISEFFKTQGERSGMTPRELFDISGLNVKGERIGDGLNQGPTLADVKAAWDASGIKSNISEGNDRITLSKIIVPEGERGTGKGTEAMQSLVDYADAVGKHVVLSPSSDFGGNKKQLTDFYKRFGFVENKGKNRAFTTTESMYRTAPGKVLHQDNRGAFDPETSTLALLKAADLSTFLHESGHFFLEASMNMAARPEATEGMRSDMGTLLDHFGIKGTDGRTPLEQWHEMTLDEKRESHENFARGFEKYLMQGKAPTLELQSMFSRFRSWLLNIYKSLSGLDVKLAPEVRGVMDRMLASDEAIKEAEQTRKYKLVFDTPEAAKVSLEQFNAYENLGKEATDQAIADMTSRSMQDMQWASNAKSKVLKDLQKEAAGKRKVIQIEVTKEVMAQPVEQARSYMKSGKLFDADGNELPDTRPLGAPRIKLDLADLKSMYPEGALGNPDLTKIRNLTGKDGLHPDIVADMFGIADGHELIRQLTEAEPPKEMIERLTNQQMLERHGELTDAQSIESAAEAAIHNEARAKFMATGLKILSKSPIPARELAKAAKEAAEAAIAAKRVRDLRPAQYLAAESRSNADAIKNATKDPQVAVQAQRAALLNNRLFKAASDAVTEIQKQLTYLGKFDKASVRDKIDLEYRDQIDALLDRYDLRKSVTGEALDKREALMSFVERMAAQGYEPQIPEKLLNEAQRQHYKDMTVEEFKGLVDAVKSIDHLGRLKNTLLDGKEAKNLAMLATEAKETMAQLPQREAETNRGLNSIETKWLSAKSAGRSLQAALLKMEQMMDWLDNRNPNGVLNRVVFRRIADAGVKEYDLQAKVKAGIDDLMSKHLHDVTKDGSRIYDAPGLIDGLTGEGQKFTKKEMLALAGNMGNDSNVAKLVKGEGWDEAAVWDFLHKNMGKADWDFVAGLGKTLESLWPEKLEMSRRLGNTNPDKIAPRAFDTPHGRYEGWYWPMIYDPARSQDAAERGARAADQMFENTYTRATTDTGSMNTRNENYARPLLLSLDTIPRVIKDEIHDIAYREAIIDADKFISNGTVRKSIISALSQEHYDQLRPWLQSIANDRKVDMQALKWFDQLAHGARTRSTIVGLGYRISTMLVHGSSAAAESIAEVGPGWFGKGLADFANPAQWTANRDFIFERSGEMRNRMNEVDRDVREHLREIDLRLMDTTTGIVARGTDLMKAHAYQGIAMLDMASALPTWMGAYHKGMAPAEQGGKGMSEADAVYFADKTVRNAHGGTGVKDMAAIQRGPEFLKLFTMFYTFWNHNVNRLMDTARMAKELPDTYRTGMPGEFRGDLGTVIMRTLIYTLGIQAMHSMLHPSKDDQGDTNWLAWAGKEFTAAAFSGIPVLRDLSAHYLTGKDYSATPAASMVSAIGNSGSDAMNAMAGHEVSEKWVKHSVTTAGYVFGLPLGQAASATQFLWDVGAGHQSPQDISDWWRGVMHGDMQKH